MIRPAKASIVLDKCLNLGGERRATDKGSQAQLHRVFGAPASGPARWRYEGLQNAVRPEACAPLNPLLAPPGRGPLNIQLLRVTPPREG